MYENHQTDDEMYKTMQTYTTICLEKIHSTNKRYMKEYEQQLDEKARMDMRVGRKPKNYHNVVGLVQKYRKEYAFIKRTQPIVEKILKERNQELEKELQRKEKALAEAAALLLLKKKLDALMTDQKDG